MNHDNTIRALNNLIETSKDGEYGFTACAKHVTASDLRAIFNQRATECQRAAEELQTLVQQYGGEPEIEGSTSGALHRGWLAVRGSLTGYSDQSLLDECERGEDAALARYRAALRDDTLPEQVRAVITRQQLGVQANHDQIKRLRDVAKAA